MIARSDIPYVGSAAYSQIPELALDGIELESFAGLMLVDVNVG